MSIKRSNLTKLTDKLLNDQSKFDQLRAIANKKNYSHKVKLLHARISEEYDFWSSKKNPTQKLLDLDKDRTFIESQVNSENLDKARIDLLTEKYNIGHGESRITN